MPTPPLIVTTMDYGLKVIVIGVLAAVHSTVPLRIRRKNENKDMSIKNRFGSAKNIQILVKF